MNNGGGGGGGGGGGMWSKEMGKRKRRNDGVEKERDQALQEVAQFSRKRGIEFTLSVIDKTVCCGWSHTHTGSGEDGGADVHDETDGLHGSLPDEKGGDAYQCAKSLCTHHMCISSALVNILRYLSKNESDREAHKTSKGNEIKLCNDLQYIAIRLAVEGSQQEFLCRECIKVMRLADISAGNASIGTLSPRGSVVDDRHVARVLYGNIDRSLFVRMCFQMTSLFNRRQSLQHGKVNDVLRFKRIVSRLQLVRISVLLRD